MKFWNRTGTLHLLFLLLRYILIYLLLILTVYYFYFLLPTAINETFVPFSCNYQRFLIFALYRTDTECAKAVQLWRRLISLSASTHAASINTNLFFVTLVLITRRPGAGVAMQIIKTSLVITSVLQQFV